MELLPHQYRTLGDGTSGEIKDKGSRFIAYARRIAEEDDARAFFLQVKKDHHKASHHCTAFRLGYPEVIERFNDDGEPGGTAGKPILGQIHAFELNYVAIMVVRYYGGVKLGTGGLIQAYRTAAAEALSHGQIIVAEILQHAEVSLDYSCSHYFLDAVKKMHLDVISQHFGERAIFRIALVPDNAEATLLQLKSQTLQLPLEMAQDASDEAWEVTLLGLS